jgi:hypothetical protein
MKVNEVSLKQLLNGQITFLVPPFQRSYAWRQREFERLWEDISGILDGERDRHFMGTVVLEPINNKEFSVIDGQQRLATFTVLLKVLSELAYQLDRTFGNSLSSTLVSNRVPKFIPSLRDKESFIYLREQPQLLRKTKHKNVWSCYDYFHRIISDHLANAKGRKLNEIRKLSTIVLENLCFVKITLADKDDAPAIFETINYTGVPINAADLARNFVLGLTKSGQEQQKLNFEYWQKIEDAVKDSISDEIGGAQKDQLQKVLPEFLRTVLIIEQGKYISFSELYRQLRIFFRKGTLQKQLEVTLKYAEIFRVCNNPEYEKSKKLKMQLMRFKGLRMTTHFPALMILYRAYTDGRVSLQSLLDAMQFIESYVIRRAFNSKVSRDLNKQFAEVASELSKHPRSSNLSAILRSSLAKRKWPTDDEFKTNFVSSPIYSTAPTIARFSLISIESLQGNQNELATDSRIQIEHVFPQKPSNGWVGDLTELKKNLHVIGNLTLTGYNSKYGNKSFKEKMSGVNGLKKSPYWLNKIIAQENVWTAEEIKKRGTWLMRSAMKIWPGPPRMRT